jgi:hypothetical protein
MTSFPEKLYVAISAIYACRVRQCLLIAWLLYCLRASIHFSPNVTIILTRRDETKRKTQKRTERRSGERSSSVGSEKMERVGDR